MPNAHETKTIQGMKILAYITFTLLTLSFVTAQKGKVTIEQDEKIEQLLAAYSASVENEYYTIQVGFVSSDGKAQQLKSMANIDFPELSSRVDFKSPTYRVRVGRFKSKIDAERKFKEVRKKYPQAMLLKQQK